MQNKLHNIRQKNEMDVLIRMLRMLIFFSAVSLSLYAVSYANVSNKTFIVSSVEFKGLNGINKHDISPFIAIKKGDKFTIEKSNKIIKTLYASKLFSNIKIYRDGTKLIVAVDQLPIISNFIVTGNKMIPSERLTKVLTAQGLFTGAIFNQELLDHIKKLLRQEYISQGKYDVLIDVNVHYKSHNRVTVAINIYEGLTAKIVKINIVGNYAFSTKELLKNLSISTGNFLSIITKSNEYSNSKFDDSLEKLTNFYMDRGYSKFKIKSSQISITPDKKSIYINVDIDEGNRYIVSGYDFRGNFSLSKNLLESLVSIKLNKMFSRATVMDSIRNIERRLNEIGYANAKLDVIPKFNDKNRSVYLTFTVNLGKKMYVRYINFTGNIHTNEDVLRRAIYQIEGALYSPDRIDESKMRLINLPSGSVENVDVKTFPVSGVNNQVDLNYNIVEKPSASINGSISYSNLTKFGIGAGITHRNVFGSGNTLSVNISKNSYLLSGGISYYNPYYTTYGIGRSFEIFGNSTDSRKTVISDYVLDSFGTGVTYYFPLSPYSKVSIGLSLEKDALKLGKMPAQRMKDFVLKHGNKFLQPTISINWSRGYLNNQIFPTKGLIQAINLSSTVSIGDRSLEYYVAGYNIYYVKPINNFFAFSSSFRIKYGNGYGKYDTLPFFRNFYAGGIGTVRGYEDGSLGPLAKGTLDPIGGNLFVGGTVSLLSPTFIDNNARISLFFDAGNIYNGVKDLKNFSKDPLRCSVGAQLDFFLPMLGGNIQLSIAKPLNARPGDQTRAFQFSIGAPLQ